MVCGWGVQEWGIDPWGNGEDYPPVVISSAPKCGATKISPCSKIIIKVASLGCATLDIDCTTIDVNGTTIYDGTGLTFGVDQDDGFATPCDGSGSAITTEASTIYNEVWVFTLDCGCFSCGTTVSWTGNFCTTQGQTASVSCSYTLAPCFYISNVEIIDTRRYLLRFTNPAHGDRVTNAALYNPNSYTVTPVDAGIITGRHVRVKTVKVDQSLTPSYVIVELDKTTDGAAYLFSGSNNILDIYNQNLLEYGQGIGFSRTTKVDAILKNLPNTYNKDIDTVTDNTISPFHIAAAIGIEDDRSGGSN